MLTAAVDDLEQVGHGGASLFAHMDACKGSCCVVWVLWPMYAHGSGTFSALVQLQVSVAVVYTCSRC